MTRTTPARLAVLLVLAPFAVQAQTSIGPNGIRSGNTAIDSGGVHTDGADVTGSGVQARPAGRGETVIAENGLTRSVDCRGGSLRVDGNGNRLRTTGCTAVSVNGNGNDLRAAYTAAGTAAGRLDVLGNGNRVSWHAGPRVRVAVTNSGTGNSVTER